MTTIPLLIQSDQPTLDTMTRIFTEAGSRACHDPDIHGAFAKQLVWYWPE